MIGSFHFRFALSPYAQIRLHEVALIPLRVGADAPVAPAEEGIFLGLGLALLLLALLLLAADAPGALTEESVLLGVALTPGTTAVESVLLGLALTPGTATVEGILLGITLASIRLFGAVTPVASAENGVFLDLFSESVMICSYWNTRCSKAEPQELTGAAMAPLAKATARRVMREVFMIAV